MPMHYMKYGSSKCVRTVHNVHRTHEPFCVLSRSKRTTLTCEEGARELLLLGIWMDMYVDCNKELNGNYNTFGVVFSYLDF